MGSHLFISFLSVSDIRTTSNTAWSSASCSMKRGWLSSCRMTYSGSMIVQNRTWVKKSLLFQVDFRSRPRATGRIAQTEIKWSSAPKPSNILIPVMIKISLRSTKMRLTSSAMTKVEISSLTCKNISGSFSNSRALLTPDVKCETTTSQSSSTSLQDRKVPVVSKTRDSTRKKPSISWVNASREDNGRGVGRIRSDWA